MAASPAREHKVAARLRQDIARQSRWHRITRHLDRAADDLSLDKKRAGRSPLSLTVTGTCRFRLQWRMLHVHSAHAAHAAAWGAMRMLVVLRRLSDHDFGGWQQ